MEQAPTWLWVGRCIERTPLQFRSGQFRTRHRHRILRRLSATSSSCAAANEKERKRRKKKKKKKKRMSDEKLKDEKSKA